MKLIDLCRFYLEWLFSTMNVLFSDLIMNSINTYLTICVVWERFFGLKCGLSEFIIPNLSLISINISEIINTYLLKPVLSPKLSLEFVCTCCELTIAIFLNKKSYLLLVLKLMEAKALRQTFIVISIHV